MQSQNQSDPTQKTLCSQAFIVACDWLRSQFYRFFHGPPTTKDVVNILLEDDMGSLWLRLYPFMGVFNELTTRRLRSDSELPPFYWLGRVFPEMDQLQLYSEILEKFLVMRLK